MRRLDLDVGADVYEESGRAARGKKDSYSGALDALQESQFQHRGGNGRAGVAGGYDRIYDPFFGKVHAHRDRGILFLTDGDRGGFIHADKTARVMNRDGLWDILMLLKFRMQKRLVADEH